MVCDTWTGGTVTFQVTGRVWRISDLETAEKGGSIHEIVVTVWATVTERIWEPWLLSGTDTWEEKFEDDFQTSEEKNCSGQVLVDIQEVKEIHDLILVDSL